MGSSRVAALSPYAVQQHLPSFSDFNQHCCVDYFEAVVWNIHGDCVELKIRDSAAGLDAEFDTLAEALAARPRSPIIDRRHSLV